MTYLDYAASAPLRSSALQAMLPFLTEQYGNASGAHAVARNAKYALEEAREQIAELLEVAPREVIFTSGGTESNNLAIKGSVHAQGTRGRVIVSSIEHKAILAPAERLATEGLDVCLAPVTADGMIDLDALAALCNDQTVLVSVMLVNNEVGTIQPLREIGKFLPKEYPNAVLHTDAVQAAAWFDIVPPTRRAHLISLSAHKFGGPKGIGALIVRNGTPLQAEIEGGGQEWELRAGSVNVAGVVGMATALQETIAERDETAARVASLRNALAEGLRARIPTLVINAEQTERIPGALHITIPNVEADALVVLLDQAGICVSIGSSCASGATEPSHVLTAMGRTRDQARASIRITLGYQSTGEDITHALEVIPQAVQQLNGSLVGAA